MSGLIVDDISMTFELPQGGSVEALKNVSIDIKEGELISVLGPSGCGKTTLLNILAGFLAPTGGQISLNEHKVTGPSSERGMVFQQGALFEWMNVSKNIGFGPKMKGTPQKEIDAKVEELLGIVGLQDFGQKMIYELSGGMQQRVALARCLANEPDVVLMDEPLGRQNDHPDYALRGRSIASWRTVDRHGSPPRPYSQRVSTAICRNRRWR